MADSPENFQVPIQIPWKMSDITSAALLFFMIVELTFHLAILNSLLPNVIQREGLAKILILN